MVPRNLRPVAALVAAAFLVLGVLLAGIVLAPSAAPATPAPLAGTLFSFGAAGDYGFSGDAQAVMSAMGSSGLDFVVALGDFTYQETSTDNWCNFFESQVGDGHVIVISGNHDTGDIATFAQFCNFGIDAAMNGDYGTNFYFDFPRSSPLARFILTTQGTMGGDASGFVSGAIDGARSASIPWVIVGMHKDCITDGSKSCEIGQGFLDMLLSKRVDLVLQGHDHNYQRSHQLTCATDNTFRQECVADTSDTHTHGAGTVLNIVGTGGRPTYSTGGTPDEGYFKTWTSSTKGFLKVDVSADAMVVSFRNVVGTYTDGYRIVRGASGPGPSPDFSVSASPTSVSFVAGQSASTTIQVQPANGFAGSIDLAVASSPTGVDGGCSPETLSGGGTATCVLSASTPGSYTATITGTGGGLVHSVALNVVVNPPPPGPDTTPPSITITSPSNDSVVTSSPVTIRGVASDNVGLQKVEWSADGTSWTATSGTSSWSAVVPVALGSDTIYVRATDSAGNRQVATITLIVQVSPGVPAQPQPVDSTPQIFGIRLAPIVLGLAAGVAGLAASTLLVARARRNARRRRNAGGRRRR
jgi:3',5'-cyclic AMP phosphodiesterase CpdA